jgi:O-acetyl-ADP-ribose deacetylase (regulator of RNase III)
MTFKLILSAISPDLFEAFKKHFAQFPQVEVVFKPFEQTEFDCVVSAANSFGLMDGGVDQCITDYFGVQMMNRVQAAVLEEYYGEQPVGTSMIVRGNENFSFEVVEHNVESKELKTVLKKNKYVAHTPTMRIPMNINNTSYVYSAMKAMLIAVEKHNQQFDEFKRLGIDDENTRIDIVVCPGLGTNAGRVPAEEAAKMMSIALIHFLNPPKSINWYFATQRHSEIQNRRIEAEDENNIDLSQFEDLK